MVLSTGHIHDSSIHKKQREMRRFVPLTSRFNNTKWKRPLSGEIRNQIKRKKVSGGIISKIKILLPGCNTQNREIK